jgi:hypothetical protein
MPETSEAKPQSQLVPSRQLVIHVLLSALVAVAVFVVLSYATLVPRLAHHERRILDLEAQLGALQDDSEAAADPAPTATPAAPAVAK